MSELLPLAQLGHRSRGALAELLAFGQYAGHTNANPQGRHANAGTSRPLCRYPILCTAYHEIQHGCGHPDTKRSSDRLGLHWACTSVAFFA